MRGGGGGGVHTARLIITSTFHIQWVGSVGGASEGRAQIWLLLNLLSRVYIGSRTYMYIYGYDCYTIVY